MSQQGQIVQVSNEANLYANSGQYVYVDNTTLTVKACQMRDSTNSLDINLNADTTLNFAINGLNGLDTGSIAASSVYGIYLVSDATSFKPTGVMASLNLAGAPFMPAGYGYLKLVGYVFTDGSSHIIKFRVSGTGNTRDFYYDSTVRALTNGASQTLANIDLTGIVPPFSYTPVKFVGTYTPNTAGDTAGFAPFGSTATLLPFVPGTVATKASSQTFEVLAMLNAAAPTILYINSAASGQTNVYVTGFRFYI